MVCDKCKAELKCGNTGCCNNPPPNFKYVDGELGDKGIVKCSECGYTQHEDTFHDDTEALNKIEAEQEEAYNEVMMRS